MAVVGVALPSAVAFGWSTALMHQAVFSAIREVRGVLMLLGHAFSQWRWLLGFAASLAGLALHAAALHLGALTVVQPIVVSGLVFGLACHAALERRPPRPFEPAMVLLGAAAGVVALNVNVLTTRPLYVLAVLGVAGFLRNQQAYRVAPFGASFPAMNVVNPLVALVFGVTAFGEYPGSDGGAVLLEIAGLAMLLIGICVLAHREAPSRPMPLDDLAVGIPC